MLGRLYVGDQFIGEGNFEFSVGHFDEEVEETIVAPNNLGAAADTDVDAFSVSVGTDSTVCLYLDGEGHNMSLDEATRLVDKLSWVLQSASTLNDRVPF